MHRQMTYLVMQEDLPERFPVDTFRIPTQITSHISLDRLRLVVMWEIWNQEMWQMFLAIRVS